MVMNNDHCVGGINSVVVPLKVEPRKSILLIRQSVHLNILLHFFVFVEQAWSTICWNGLMVMLIWHCARLIISAKMKQLILPLFLVHVPLCNVRGTLSVLYL